jgi:hypothetical protein
MLGLRLVLAAAVLLAAATVGRAEPPAVLPALSFEDQEGDTLDLVALRGRVAVIVYGTRDGLEHHARWGRRLHEAMVARGLYRADDPPDERPVRILAVAQMGGIPPPFRSVVRTLLRGRIPAGFSLYLDWDDRMSGLFGAQRTFSTVVVSDRDGRVRQVAVGLPRDELLQHVVDVIGRLA